MLRIILPLVCLFISNTGLVIGGYSIGSRNRDYTSGSYSSSGFVGLGKDTHSELSDQLTSGSNYGTSSHQYSTSLTGRGHSNQGSSYASSGNEDSTQTNGYGSHSSNNPDALNSITSSSYTNDAYTTDVSPVYSPGSSNSDGYSNGHGSPPGLAGYAGHTSNLAGLPSTNDHNADYPSSSSAYVTASPSINSNYALGGPKASAYAAISKNHGHIPASSYSLGTSLNLIPNSHASGYPTSNYLSGSYPGNHLNPTYSGNRHASSSFMGNSGHKSYPEGGTRFISSGGNNPVAAALSYLSPHSPHSRDSPTSFIHPGGPSSTHRQIPPFLHAAASNVNMNFVKGPSLPPPGPGYYSGAFPKNGGSKFIIIKDAPSHGGGGSGLLHGGEQHSFPSSMFAGGATSYKVRSASPFPSGSHFTGSNYRSSFISGYPAGSGSPTHSVAHSNASPGSYFGYQ